MIRRRGRLDRPSVVASAVSHALAIAAFWFATSASKTEPAVETVEIEMVSALPLKAAEEERDATDDVVVETPEPDPAAEPDPPPPRETDESDPPDPEPAEDEDPPEDARTEIADEPEEPASAAEPDEEAEETGSEINVRLEGVRRDYPEYYENIINQINRCFRRPAEGSWETTVSFDILSDGSVANAEFQSRSGNTAFDLQAYRAIVDCAGRGRFGPLPEELPYERLPVSFDFRPSGGGSAPERPSTEEAP